MSGALVPFRRDLKAIATDLQTAMRRESTSIIDIGRLLTEANQQLDHGQWLPWLKENFAGCASTAHNYMAAAALAVKFPTVGNLKLRPSALYWLARYVSNGKPLCREGGSIATVTSSDAFDAIAREAEPHGVGEERAIEIVLALLDAPEVTLTDDDDDEDDTDDSSDEYEDEDGGDDDDDVNEEADQDDEDEEPAPDDNDDDEDTAEDDEFDPDSPPPELPPAPPPAPPKSNLEAFDQAVTALKRLQTKPATTLVDTTLSAEDLRVIAEFLLFLAAKIERRYAA
jgi:hypothetical protein